MIEGKIAIIGLGYVGLPLAIEFGKIRDVIGFDINNLRIEELKRGCDRQHETDSSEFIKSKFLSFSADPKVLHNAKIFIVTVPTSIDKYKKPDLSHLLNSSETVGRFLKKGDVVIYESTVYPGCTEDDCVPILEKFSGLKFNIDFFCGYSPERIVPGDKRYTLKNIRKITSGSTKEIAEEIDCLYNSIIIAGTYQAPSIKVAEAAKVIENCQRDLNISFVNELALIFDRMDLDTSEILEAASSKFNFLPFKPGLVGGHCISIDPYYLTSKSESLGYYPEVIHSGRKINDNMGSFIANKVVKLMIKKDLKIKGSNVLILGITFKENCSDLRNSKVIDVISELIEFGLNVFIYDPYVNKSDFNFEKKVTFLEELKEFKYHSIIHAVSHDDFKNIDFKKYLTDNSILFDVKSVLPKNIVDGRL